MRVVLIPWILNKNYNSNSERIIPLGLMSISAHLKKRGYVADIRDLNMDARIDIAEMTEELLGESYDVYGFSAAAGTLHIALQLADRIKAKAPEKIIVFGGPHPTLVYQKLLYHFPSIDYIICGEGEETFLELLEAFKGQKDIAGVKGIVFRQNNEIKITSKRELICDLDTINMPDYDTCLPMYGDSIHSVPIEIGRGCPFSCSYCASSVLWGRKHRVKSIDRIIDELTYIHNKFSITMFYFRHDQIVLNRAWLIELCGKINSCLPGIKWQCSARIDTVDRELLRMMKGAGCIGIEFGLESFSHTVQKSINKNIDLEQAIQNLMIVIEENINPVLFFMCGFPNETKEDLRLTLNALLKICSSCHKSTFFQLRTLQPFPGTQIKDNNRRDMRFDRNRLDETILENYSKQQLQLAKQDFDLFPEFYYIQNLNNIPLERFLFLEKIFNSVVRFYNTHFFLVFKCLIHIYHYEYEEVLSLLETYLDLGRITDYSEDDFIEALLKMVEQNSSIQWLIDLYQYEKEIYARSVNYKKVEMKDWTKHMKLIVNPNFNVVCLNYELNHMLEVINGKHIYEHNLIAEKSYLGIFAASKDNIVTFKINKQLNDFLSCFSQSKTFDENKEKEHIGMVKQLIREKVLLIC